MLSVNLHSKRRLSLVLISKGERVMMLPRLSGLAPDFLSGTESTKRSYPNTPPFAEQLIKMNLFLSSSRLALRMHSPFRPPVGVSSVTVSLQPGAFRVERVAVPPNLPMAVAPLPNRRAISGSFLLATAASYSAL